MASKHVAFLMGYKLQCSIGFEELVYAKAELTNCIDDD